MKNSASSITDFDSYLLSVPGEARPGLLKLYAAIKAAAPSAEELISYGIPSFRQDYMLVALGAAKKHCSFYVMSPALIKDMSEQLINYKTSAGTIHFPFDSPLPTALVKKIVNARLHENKLRRSAAATVKKRH